MGLPLLSLTPRIKLSRSHKRNRKKNGNVLILALLNSIDIMVSLTTPIFDLARSYELLRLQLRHYRKLTLFFNCAIFRIGIFSF